MSLVALYGLAIHYDAALVLVAIFIGLATRLGYLLGRGREIVKRH